MSDLLPKGMGICSECSGPLHRDQAIEHIGTSIRHRIRQNCLYSLHDQLAASEKRLADHYQHIGRFLSDMYCTMIDPLAEGTTKVAETCKDLLNAAVEQRQREHDLIIERDRLTADNQRLTESIGMANEASADAVITIDALKTVLADTVKALREAQDFIETVAPDGSREIGLYTVIDESIDAAEELLKQRIGEK